MTLDPQTKAALVEIKAQLQRIETGEYANGMLLSDKDNWQYCRSIAADTLLICDTILAEPVVDEEAHSNECPCCQNFLRMEKQYDHLRGFPQDDEKFEHKLAEPACDYCRDTKAIRIDDDLEVSPCPKCCDEPAPASNEQPDECRHVFGNMADWPRPCMTCGKSEVEITADNVMQIVKEGKRKLISYDLLHAPMTAKAPSSRPNPPSSPTQPAPGGDVVELRAQGWTVAVHNDYRLNGEAHTFWLFTNGSRCAKGEGKTDAEALAKVRAAIATLQPVGGVSESNKQLGCGHCACGRCASLSKERSGEYEA